MPKWVRIILGIIAGVFAAGASVAAIEALAHQLFTGPAVFVMAALGLGVAAFVGGAIAAWISKLSLAAWIIAGVLGLLSLVNIVSFPHPVWFAPAAAVCLVIGAWLVICWRASRGA